MSHGLQFLIGKALIIHRAAVWADTDHLQLQRALEKLLDGPESAATIHHERACACVQLCVEARIVLMSVLSRNHPASMPAKQAGYAYIAQFGAICRMQHLPPEHGEQSQFEFSPLP